jgi:hypothetical protein
MKIFLRNDSFDKADEELGLDRESDVDSEMAYQMWEALHAELAGTITRISEQGAKLARRADMIPGPIRYLWADAIANQLCADHEQRRGASSPCRAIEPVRASCRRWVR